MYEETLEFIVCETLAAAAILGADFCDLQAKAKRPKQKVVELDNSDCIQIATKQKGRLRDRPPLPDKLAYLKDSPGVSPLLSEYWKKLHSQRSTRHG